MFDRKISSLHANRKKLGEFKFKYFRKQAENVKKESKVDKKAEAKNQEDTCRSEEGDPLKRQEVEISGLMGCIP